VLKQRINGKTVATLYVEGSAGDIGALKALMEGQVDEYELKSSGGTSAALPTQLESKRCSVGKKVDAYSRVSCVFRIPHLPASKSEDDVRNAVLGKFDCHYDLTEACEYFNYLKGGNR